MKKSAKLKRKTIRMIVKNSIVLVALAAVAFASVMSWFKDDPEVTASGLTASAKVDDGLEFFIINHNTSNVDQYNAINNWISTYNSSHASDTGFVAKGWHSGELNFDFSDPELKFMEDLFLCEVTGDGKTFSIPKLKQYDEVAYVDEDEALEAATANENYMSFDIYFRCKVSGTVALKSESSISPHGTLPNNLSAATVGNGVTEDQMKLAAIGALRLSVVNGNNRSLLWIPAPNIWYDGWNAAITTGLTTGNYNHGSAYYDEDYPTAYPYRPNESTTSHSYYYTDNNTTTRTTEHANNNTVIASTSGNYQLGRSVNLLTLSAPTGNDIYYHGHLTVNLWIEGEDAEARLAMVGGRFNMSLSFDLADQSNSGN